jgi:hypothetical protein
MADFGPLGGVKITGFISPTDTNDTYAVIDPLYGIDGLRNITGGTAGLDLIPNLRRRAGMIVGVNDGAAYYQLNSAPWSGTFSDWTLLNLSGGTDTFITGMTFNAGNYNLTIGRNDGASFTESLGILAGDMWVTGGTYDINTGIVTFTNNSGGTFQVSGFTSGMTDSYTTTAYTVGNVIRFDNNLQGTNFYNVDLTPILTGVTGSTPYRYNSSESTAIEPILGSNNATGLYANIGGGSGNTASSIFTTVAGGADNTASNLYATVGGGENNTASNFQSTVAGGDSNTASGIASTVGGGTGNTASSSRATIAGGQGNQVTTNHTFIGGGLSNTIAVGGNHSSIVGGDTNYIDGQRGFIGGGTDNIISASTYSSILGGQNNIVNHNNSQAIGSFITTISADTTHIENLNIVRTPILDNSVGNFLVRDTDGTVKYRTTIGGGSISGDTFTTGATLNGTNLDFDNNNSLSAYTVDLGSLTFSGGSGTCISDLYVTNIHSCSPLFINPLDEGNLYFGASSGFTLEIVTGTTFVGVNTSVPGYALHIANGDLFIQEGNAAIGGSSPDSQHRFRVTTEDINGANSSGIRVDMSYASAGGAGVNSFQGIQVRSVPPKTFTGITQQWGVTSNLTSTYSTTGYHMVVGGRFRAASTNAINYGIQIEDGTEAAGKVLVCQPTSLYGQVGLANWGTVSSSGITSDTYVDNAYLNGDTIVFDKNDSVSAFTVDLEPLLSGFTTGDTSPFRYNSTTNTAIEPVLGSNSATGTSSTIAGGINNTAASSYSFIGGGSGNNVNSGNYGLIGSGSGNIVNGTYSPAILTGYENNVTGNYSLIGTGYRNVITGNYSTIANGYLNTISTNHGFIGSGRDNTVSGIGAFIGAGDTNVASGANSFIGGGINNSATTTHSIVIGGDSNFNSGFDSSIVGGSGNTVSGSYSVIGGGNGNTVSGSYSVWWW